MEYFLEHKSPEMFVFVADVCIPIKSCSEREISLLYLNHFKLMMENYNLQKKEYYFT